MKNKQSLRLRLKQSLRLRLKQSLRLRLKQSLRSHGKLFLIFAFALLFRLVLAPITWHPDVTNHVDWGIRFYEYGANKFYAPESNVWSFTWPNQPPGTILIFAFIRKLYELVFNILWQLNVAIPAFPSNIIVFTQERLYQTLLKLPSIAADLGIAYLIYKICIKLKNKSAGYFGALIFLLNPVVWYNSAVWGQTDAVINFFALLSFFLLTRKKIILAAIFLAICLYIKISLIIFLPLFAIYIFKQRYSFTKLIVAITAPSIGLLIVTLLFSYPNEPLSWLIEVYKVNVLGNQLQVITANAFNIWAFLTGIREQSHNLLFGPLSARDWGYFLFAFAYLPLLYKLWRNPVEKTAVWVFAITAFSSWMLLTNMHERYLYPLYPYFAILVALNRTLLPLYLGISGINLVNLYNLWWVPNVEFFRNSLTALNGALTRFLSIVNTVFYLVFYSKFLKYK